MINSNNNGTKPSWNSCRMCPDYWITLNFRQVIKVMFFVTGLSRGIITQALALSYEGSWATQLHTHTQTRIFSTSLLSSWDVNGGLTMSRWPGETDLTYPEVFNNIPAHAKYAGKPGQLSDAQISQYYKEVRHLTTYKPKTTFVYLSVRYISDQICEGQVLNE